MAEDGKEKKIADLSQRIEELRHQVQSASLEMEMLRAQMNDLQREGRQAVNLERFPVPDQTQMNEINEMTALLYKAILKERKSRRHNVSAPLYSSWEDDAPAKPDARVILIALKLRRKNCTVREIAAHLGLGYGTAQRIIKKYSDDPDIRDLVTGGTQLDLSDYLLIRPDLDED